MDGSVPRSHAVQHQRRLSIRSEAIPPWGRTIPTGSPCREHRVAVQNYEAELSGAREALQPARKIDLFAGIECVGKTANRAKGRRITEVP